MKIYGIIFRISFLSYLAVMSVAKYVTARTFADITLGIFLLCCVYELIYVIWLRKKENVSFRKALTELFGYAFLSPVVYLILYRIAGLIVGVFFKEYAVYFHIDVYHSVSEMIFDGWANLTLLLAAVPLLIYIVIYLIFICIVKDRRDKI